MNSSYIDVIATENDSQQRLDQFLTAKLDNTSRSQVQQWIEKKTIVKLIQNESVFVSASSKVKPHDHFRITLTEAEPTHIKAQEIPLDIIFEDDDLLVINKAAGMVVHPAPGHFEETLVNALLGYCGDQLSGIGGVKRPGIVHRLDKDTTGLMVIAKNDFTHRALSEQFHPAEDNNNEKTLARRYKTIVFGSLTQHQITLTGWIGRHPRNRQKMALLGEYQGKLAITHLVQEKCYILDDGKLKISVLDCVLGTGRTHQIRLHCQSIKCPVVGDPVYGLTRLHSIKNAPELFKTFPRQALHAYSLTFIHPRSLKICEFNAPMPADMQELLNCLTDH